MQTPGSPGPGPSPLATSLSSWERKSALSPPIIWSWELAALRCLEAREFQQHCISCYKECSRQEMVCPEAQEMRATGEVDSILPTAFPERVTSSHFMETRSPMTNPTPGLPGTRVPLYRVYTFLM